VLAEWSKTANGEGSKFHRKKSESNGTIKRKFWSRRRGGSKHPVSVAGWGSLEISCEEGAVGTAKG